MEFSEPLNQLVSHACSFGANLNTIKFQQQNSEGVGIYSDGIISAGSVILSVPFDLCISVNAVASHKELKHVIEDQPGLLDFPDEVLAIGLMYAALHEFSDECPWALHVSTCPKSFNTPLYWSDNELELLKDCSVYHLTKMLKRQIASDWISIHEPLSHAYPSLLQGATCDLYQWALSIVYSRAVGIDRHGSYTRCIPPLIDMANHRPTVGRIAADTFAYDEALDEVRLIAAEDLKSGDQVFAVYGEYTNSKLLYTYGFALVENPFKTVDVWAVVPANSVQADYKRACLQGHELTYNQTYDFEGTLRDSYISPALLATVRIIQATEEEMEVLENAFVGTMLSVRNEMATYAALRSMVIARLKPATAQSDREQLGQMLLSNVARDDRVLLASLVRESERDIYQSSIGLLDSWTAMLMEQEDDYLPPDHEQYQNYQDDDDDDNDNNEIHGVAVRVAAEDKDKDKGGCSPVTDCAAADSPC